MQVQFVDALEFRGRQDISKDGNNYVRLTFENIEGRQIVFFSSLERLPDDLPELERGKNYLLTADLFSGRNGFGCNLLGAAPFDD